MEVQAEWRFQEGAPGREVSNNLNLHGEAVRHRKGSLKTECSDLFQASPCKWILASEYLGME